MQVQLDKPVVFFVFNRPDTTRLVFEQIKLARPRNLFVVADGPRPNRAGEEYLCAQTRQILDGIDWPCHVEVNFSDFNLGCKERIQSGLDWVFSMVDEAIILEDDCVPTEDFFPFMDAMLDRYRDDPSVGIVSGNCLILPKHAPKESYYFSAFPHIWGWATWKRMWDLYEPDMESWGRIDRDELLSRVHRRKTLRVHWKKVFDSASAIDTWDYQLVFSMWLHNKLSIAPTRNLVSNIGFRSDATHTTNESSDNQVPIGQLDWPLNHPPRVVRDLRSDRAEVALQRITILRNLLQRYLPWAYQHLKKAV